MIRFGVCDDEKEWCILIREQVLTLYDEFVGYEGQVECVLYSSGVEFIENYENDRIDIAFIDIICGERKGFDIVNELKENGANIGVIYITGYDHLVYEAFESGPLGFIRKCFLYDDMKRTFPSIIKYVEMNRKCINLSSISGEVTVPIGRINYLEVYGHKVTVYLENGGVEVRDSLANLEEELQKYNFARINRYCIVNLKYVSRVKGQECSLYNGKMLQISRDRARIVLGKWLDCIMLR